MDFRLLRHGKKEKRRKQGRLLFKDMSQKVKCGLWSVQGPAAIHNEEFMEVYLETEGKEAKFNSCLISILFCQPWQSSISLNQFCSSFWRTRLQSTADAHPALQWSCPKQPPTPSHPTHPYHGYTAAPQCSVLQASISVQEITAQLWEVHSHSWCDASLGEGRVITMVSQSWLNHSTCKVHTKPALAFEGV